MKSWLRSRYWCLRWLHSLQRRSRQKSHQSRRKWAWLQDRLIVNCADFRFGCILMRGIFNCTVFRWVSRAAVTYISRDINKPEFYFTKQKSNLVAPSSGNRWSSYAWALPRPWEWDRGRWEWLANDETAAQEEADWGSGGQDSWAGGGRGQAKVRNVRWQKLMLIKRLEETAMPVMVFTSIFSSTNCSMGHLNQCTFTEVVYFLSY